MPRPLLYLLVVTAGMTTMATEMSGSRLIAPYFGNSLFIWANLIGLILIYLTLGYYLGGRLADRRPDPQLLCLLTMAAAASIALLPFIARPVMGIAIKGMEQISAGAFLGSFAVTVLLFAVPVTILGMVPPFAIRLRMTGVETAGNVSGNLYALSTVGSIVGTFLPVLVLIPWIGTRDTMLLFAGVLAAVSAAGLGRRLWAGVPLLIIVGLAVPQGAIKPDPDSIFETESPYQYIQVVDKSGTKYLKLNEGWAVHSVYDPDRLLTGGYWDYFSIAPWFAGETAPEKVLVIGNAAGSIPRLMTSFYPDVQLDGVEIDPGVVEAGRRFFDMNEPNLTVHVADGRPFLKTSNASWDMIAVDAFRQPYIPFYLTTREFFEETRDHLTNQGVVMINVGKTPGDSAVADAIAATMRDVYPSVYSFSTGQFNELVVATKQPSNIDDLRDRTSFMPPQVSKLATEISAGLSEVQPGGVILTDDKAPVEWLTDQMIIDYATAGQA
ncbi:MAG: fused MFS/spermidine synthase [Thermoleophilia bacterium]|nr:fused MFS/spermidine synthase [Thermoleophilia bacterium]